MKICNSCMVQLEDNAVFCVICGAKQGPQEHMETSLINNMDTKANENTLCSPSAVIASSVLSSDNAAFGIDARALLIKNVTSILFLTGIVLSIAAVAAILASVFFVDTVKLFYMDRILPNGDKKFLAYFLRFPLFFGVLIACAPSIITIIGAFLFRAACKKNNRKTTGITMLKVMAMINYIAIAVYTLLLMLIEITSLLSEPLSNTINFFDLSEINTFFSTVIAFLFPFLLYLFLAKSLTSIRTVFLTGEPLLLGNASAIMLIAAGVLYILLSYGSYDIMGIVYVISFIILCASNVVFAICIFLYNKDIKNAIKQTKL